MPIRGDARAGLLSALGRVARRVDRNASITTDPNTVGMQPRYGRGDLPPHHRLWEVLEESAEDYGATVELIAKYADDLREIPFDADDELEPRWNYPPFSGLDAASLYCLIRERRPRAYVEIGSGNSTRFAARAKRDGGLSTRLIAIDPQPRLPIDAVCDEVHRRPLQDVDLEMFGQVQPGDVVFLDGSHYVRPNNDVTTFFLDVVPELPQGVLLGVHDVFFPDDYGEDLAAYGFSEQYMLAPLLLLPRKPIDPVLACHFVNRAPEHHQHLRSVWEGARLDPGNHYGCAFWFEVAPVRGA